MREKQKTPLFRVPRLTRGQKLARNLICCVLLAALLLVGLLYFDCIRLRQIPLPAEWRFRLAERSALLQPGEIVAQLPMRDAFYWESPGPYSEDEDLIKLHSVLSSEYKDVRFLLDRGDGWLRVFEAGLLDRIMGIFPAGPGDVPVCFYDLHLGLDFHDVPELAELIVYSDLPAVRVEAELAVRDEAGDTVLRGGGAAENGACLIIAERIEDGPPPEAVFVKNEFWLRVRLLDENGAVLAERSGNVGYRGGWIE